MRHSPVRAGIAVLVVSLFSIVSSPSAAVERVFATRIAGSDWERAQAVCVDDAGFIFLAGSTKSNDFPTTPGAYDESGSPGTDNDGWVAKLTPDGSDLEWATYLHGNDRDDIYGILVDDAGFVYVAGWTRSSDYPVTAGVHDTSHNGDMDVVVTKLSPDGSSLVYSTFVGGGAQDQTRGGMALSAGGSIYISGQSSSGNFPTTTGAFQETNKLGDRDAFLFHLSADGSALLASTFIGSLARDHAFIGARLHTDGTVFIAGVAGDDDFPVTGGAYQTTFGGVSANGAYWHGDLFVTRFSGDLTTLVYSTFVGGSEDDKASQNSLFIDAAGNATLAGTSESSDYPVTAGAFQSGLGGGLDMVVSTLSPTGATLVASTYIGGSGAETYIEASGLCRDNEGRVHLGGTISESDYPVTGDALQGTFGGVHDGVYTILSSDLGTLVYSTYLGGSEEDRVRDLTLHPTLSEAVIVGGTSSDDFATTEGAFQELPQGMNDATAIRLRVDDAVSVADATSPRPLALALEGPVPVRGMIDVTLEIPASARAQFDLFSVDGTLALTSQTRALRPGTQRVTLATSSTLPPGVYFLRATIPGRRASSIRIPITR